MGKGEDEGVAAFNSLGTFFFPFLLFLLFLFFLDFFSFLEGDGELILGFKDFLSDIIEMDQCFAPNLKNLKMNGIQGQGVLTSTKIDAFWSRCLLILVKRGFLVFFFNRMILSQYQGLTIAKICFEAPAWPRA